MLCFFFKQKTAYELRISDWSSDVCSSDLTIGRGKMPMPPPALAMSIIVRALLQRLSDFCAMRDAAIASRIRPWIGEWLARDQTGRLASPPATADATAGLASHTRSPAPLALVLNAACADGPDADATSCRPVRNCLSSFSWRVTEPERVGKRSG